MKPILSEKKKTRHLTGQNDKKMTLIIILFIYRGGMWRSFHISMYRLRCLLGYVVFYLCCFLCPHVHTACGGPSWWQPQSLNWQLGVTDKPPAIAVMCSVNQESLFFTASDCCPAMPLDSVCTVMIFTAERAGRICGIPLMSQTISLRKQPIWGSNARAFRLIDRKKNTQWLC